MQQQATAHLYCNFRSTQQCSKLVAAGSLVSKQEVRSGYAIWSRWVI